jgi:hypothetical protein
VRSLSRFFPILWLAALVLAGCAAKPGRYAVEAKLKVERYAFCRKVENREPVKPGETFPANVGAVWFWTLVTGAEKPTKIRHVWYYGSVEESIVTLDIDHDRMRTWSYKSIPPEYDGVWRVRVIDALNRELGSYSFRITE